MCAVDRTPRHRIVARLVTLLASAVLTVFIVLPVTPPAPAGVDAPADQFSAGRAYAEVERIGAQVHVAGSPAADDVRNYIMQTLRSYGLDPQIQDAVGADDALGHGFAMAHVRNVVAVIPGTDSTGRVFAIAHYDSVQVSYGANDDGAGVTSLLESARALTHGPRLRNDIVLVFTEAEEACLCGAEAFVGQDPLAAHGGVALNFESRGSTGPAITFETTRDNAGVVGVYADAVPYPVATSFAVEVYRILPNDTDFSLFRDAGRFTGLNSAYIDGSGVYHTPEDRPSYMDKGSLQMQGANALALLRAFGDRDVATLSKPSSGDLTYFPVGDILVAYPGWLVWPLAGLALIAVIGLAVVARRRGETTIGRVFAGFGFGLIPLVGAAALAQGLWALLVAIRPGYANLDDPWQPGWYRAGVVALVATAVLTWYALLRKRFGPWGLAIGGLGWLAVLSLVLAAVTPGGSYLAALPTLGASIAGIVALLVRPLWARALALTLGTAVSVLILAPTVLLFFPALGLVEGGAAAFFAAMLGLALLPLLELLYPARPSSAASTVDDQPAPVERRPRQRRSAPALVAGVVALALAVTGFVVDRFDAVHPAPEQLMYALDTDTGQAYWVSDDAAPGQWNKQYVNTATNFATEFPPLGDSDVLTGKAPAADLPAPTVTVVSDNPIGGKRLLTLNVKPQRPVRLVYVRVDGSTVESATVDGRSVPAANLAGGFNVLFHAPPADGLPITLVLTKPGPVTVRVMDGSDGLNGLPGYTPRPAGIGVRESHLSELVLVAKTYTVP